EPGHHENLFVELRRLRQREEFSGVEPGRNHVVARPLGGRLHEERRFDLEKPLVGEEIAHALRHRVTEDDVFPERFPPEIEVAVPKPEILGGGVHPLDRKRGRLALVQDREAVGLHLDAAGRQFLVLASGGALEHGPLDQNDPLAPDGARALHGLGIEPLRPKYDLRDAVSVAEIQEEHAPVVAHPMRPPHEHDPAPRVFRPRIAAPVRPLSSGQWLDHEPAFRSRSQRWSASMLPCFASSFPAVMSLTGYPSESWGWNTA